MLPEARNAMLAVLDLDYGNPSGSHAEARAARALLEEARDRVADVVGCRSREVIFTGGGTGRRLGAKQLLQKQRLQRNEVDHATAVDRQFHGACPAGVVEGERAVAGRIVLDGAPGDGRRSAH